MRRANHNYEPLARNAVDDDIEDQNQQMTEELRDRIGLLKSLSIDIGDEVRLHDRLLSDLDHDMEHSGGFLSATMAKIGQLRRGSHNYYIFYLFLFAIFVFFVLYVFIKFF